MYYVPEVSMMCDLSVRLEDLLLFNLYLKN